MGNRLSECKIQLEVCSKHFFSNNRRRLDKRHKKVVEEQGKRVGEEDLGMDKELIAKSVEF